MERTMPLLNTTQIEELNSMINNISIENGKSLEDLLSEQVEVENSTVMQLYKLVVEEWSKKQKTIDNLCHFAITMMSTVEFLWAQKDDKEERLSQAEIVIDNLNKEILELGEENDIFKHKISETELHLDRVSDQKEKFEQLYRSQSCCDFTQEPPILSSLPSEPLHVENKLIEENSILLEQKEREIEQLRASREELENKLRQLQEENDLAKIEVELAEIAISEAISQRDASMISGNRSDLDHSYREEIYTTKSHGQFLNGDLECFSHLDDSNHKGNSLFNDILPEQCLPEGDLPRHFDLSQSYDSSLALIKESAEDITASQSPFKKKMSKISQEVSDIFSMKQSIISQPDLKPQAKVESNLLRSNKKTVSLQCNLVKGLTKLDFDYKKNLYEEEFQQKPKKTLESPKEPALVKKKYPKQKDRKESRDGPLSKSEIILKPPSVNLSPALVRPEAGKELSANNSLGKLYSFFTNKFVSQRIKVK